MPRIDYTIEFTYIYKQNWIITEVSVLSLLTLLPHNRKNNTRAVHINPLPFFPFFLFFGLSFL